MVGLTIATAGKSVAVKFAEREAEKIAKLTRRKKRWSRGRICCSTGSKKIGS